MAWHEDQQLVIEGSDTLAMSQVLQVWLPITFRTHTIRPVAQQKLYVELRPEQRAQLPGPTEAFVAAEHLLTAANRDALRSTLRTNAGLGLGFFRAAMGPTMRLALPAGWVASATAFSVKTLAGYLLNIDEANESASFLAANLAEGGKLRELWHVLPVTLHQTYFFRVIQYEVRIGSEVRQFVLHSVRYALKP